MTPGVAHTPEHGAQVKYHWRLSTVAWGGVARTRNLILADGGNKAITRSMKVNMTQFEPTDW